MCKSPYWLADGTVTACHECWQCRERAINDWVGRCVAENKTSVGAHLVSLTYGRNRVNEADHERVVALTYSDVQKFLKMFRRHGFPVRYLVAGEFGGKKGRAHWHILLFWQKRIPPGIELDKDMFNLPRFDENGEQAVDEKGNPSFYWSHGFTHWSKLGAGSARYAVKYLQKDMGDEVRQGHFSVSKKPPLGAAYFRGLAERYVAQGLAPQTLEYSYPDVKRRKENGSLETIPFMLTAKSAELFLDHYILTWGVDRPMPRSDLIERYQKWGRLVRTDEGHERLLDEEREQRWADAQKEARREWFRPKRVNTSRWKLEDEFDWVIKWGIENNVEKQQLEVEKQRALRAIETRRTQKLREQGRCVHCAAWPGQEHHQCCASRTEGGNTDAGL